MTDNPDESTEDEPTTEAMSPDEWMRSKVRPRNPAPPPPPEPAEPGTSVPLNVDPDALKPPDPMRRILDADPDRKTYQ